MASYSFFIPYSGEVTSSTSDVVVTFVGSGVTALVRSTTGLVVGGQSCATWVISILGGGRFGSRKVDGSDVSGAGVVPSGATASPPVRMGYLRSSGTATGSPP